MRIAIEPLDVVMFRDARAFGAGADHRALSLLPPPPTTLHGALRTFLAWGGGWRPGRPLPPSWGSTDDPGPVRVRGPFLGRWHGDGVLTRHPTPLDAVAVERDRGRHLRVRRITHLDWVRSDAGPRLAWVRGSGSAAAAPAALEAPDLLRYLRGEEVSVGPSEAPGGPGLGLAVLEPRVGIGLRRTQRTVGEGLLYTAGFLRLRQDAVLVADVRVGADPLPVHEGVLPLGGEQRLAHFRAVAETDWEVEAAVEAIAGRREVHLYLLTPGPFPSGSLPPGFRDVEGEIAGRRARLVAAFVGRPVRVGGFDLARGRPRPSRLAVPAGSVYHLELSDGPADETFVRTLHGSSLFPAGSAEERLGWGQVLLGTVPGEHGSEVS